MSQRYIALPARPSVERATKATYYDGFLDDMIHMPDSCTVMESDRRPVFTGLLNAEGVALYREPDSVKMGFHLR